MYKDNLIKLKEVYHPHCVFNTNAVFKKIEFDDKGSLNLQFYCDARFQGYTGRMHGGILSALLDSAMTQCLLGHGIAAYTAKLQVRFKQAVTINCDADIKATIMSSLPLDKFIHIKAEIYQESMVKIKATAVFRIIPD